MTNFEKIKQKDIYEMMIFLANFEDIINTDLCSVCQEWSCPRESCIKDWLESEA